MAGTHAHAGCTPEPMTEGSRGECSVLHENVGTTHGCQGFPWHICVLVGSSGFCLFVCKLEVLKI